MSQTNLALCLGGIGARRRRWTIGLLGALTMVVLPAFSYAQDRTEPVRAFVAATREYASMHRRLEKAIGPIELNTTTDSINRFIQQMAAAVRAERPDAEQGDLFTAAVAPELRRRINDALLEHGFTAADLRATERAQGIDSEAVTLRVNGPFPWVLSVAMFPCVLDALPPLPPELQYRIVGSNLVLLDMHAGLIVDILPSALADLTARALRLDGATQ